MKRIFVILLLCLNSGMVFSQSAKSDSLFAIGVDLYNAGKYKEAIPFFTESNTLDKKELDTLSSRRDYSAMWLSSCYYNLRDSIKALSIYKQYKLPPIDRRKTINSDRFFDQGIAFFSQGFFDKALDCFKKGAKVELAIIGKHPFYANTLSYCSDCMTYLGLYEEAIVTLYEAIEIYTKYKDYESICACNNRLSICYQQINRLDSCNFYSEKAYHGYLAQNDTLNAAISFISYVTSKRALEGNVDSNNSEKIDNILAYYKASKIIGENSMEYAYALFERALLYYYEGNYRAEGMFKEVKEIMEKKGLNRGYDYALVNYFLLGCSYFFVNNNNIYKTAVAVKSLFEQDELTLLPEYLDVIHMEVLAGIESKQITTGFAIEEENKILKIAKENFGKNCEYYVRSLLTISKLSMANDSTISRQLILEAYEIVEKEQNITPHTAAVTYQRMAQYCFYERKINETEELLEKAYSEYQNYGTPIMNGNSVFIIHDFISLLLDIALFNGCIDKFNESIDAGELVIETYKHFKWKEDYNYLQALFALQNVYNTMGNRTRLREILNEIKILCKTNPDLPISIYYFALYIEGESALAEGNSELAIYNAKEILSYVKSTTDKKLKDMFSPHACLLLIQSYLAKHDIASINQQIANLKNWYTETSIGLSNSFMTGLNSFLMFLNEDYESSLAEAKEALRKFDLEDNIGLSNSTRLGYLNLITEFAWYSKDVKMLIDAIVEQNSYIRNYLRNHFQTMTYQERCNFWEKINSWFYVKLPNGAFRQQHKTLLRECYNGLLISKGFLLNSENELKHLIEEKGDEDLKKQFENITLQKKISERQQSLSTNTETQDSLNLSLQLKEKAFLQEVSMQIGEFAHSFDMTWKDVRNKLNSDEIAIEFMSSPLSQDSVVYSALVLRNYYDAPKLIPLFKESQLQINDKELYKTSKAANLIWKPLSIVLQDVNKIYFSPIGILNNIGIEYLPLDEININEKYVTYRLSSTRQLAVVKDKNSLKHASIYGGAKYDTKEDLLLADSKRYQSGERSFSYELFEIADSLNLRSGAAYLPATKIEAEEIDRTLRQNNIATTLKLDTLATEGAFKDLSGKKTNLLHIATHGFFWTEHEAVSRNVLDISLLKNTSPKYIEDKALTRSGLLLAGANNALTGKKLPEGVDDGILTAKEISQLDLRGLDLVVLSACQTGLGEIKGDGVFGLQRGFKKAGAKSLLMSLWEVDDNATHLLMTRFYKNLTSGMSKFESLRDSQRYVREYEEEVEVGNDVNSELANIPELSQNNSGPKTRKKIKRYKDPKFWAAFILLDAID